MKKNNIIGIALLTSVGIAILTGIFASSLSANTVGNLYGLSGIGFMVFGIWGGIILVSNK